MTTIEHDVATLGALYEAHGARLRQLCERRLGNAADAEDAAHEALLKLWHTFPSYDPTRPVWPWLAKIALNVCTDLQRRQATARTRWIPSTASEAPQPDEAALARESDRVVRDALGELPPSAATALFLRDVEGWDYDRIGGHLERSPGAARVAVTRARHQLRSRVETLAKARGQWPLAGVFGGMWARARRTTDRARAAARETGARTTGWLTPGADALAGSTSSVVVPTVVSALVVLGTLVLPGRTSTPTVPEASRGAVEIAMDHAAAAPAQHVGTEIPVDAPRSAAPQEPTRPVLAEPATEAEAVALDPAPVAVAAPTLAVDVPPAPELDQGPAIAPPTVDEPDLTVAVPTPPTLDPVVPEVVIEDLGSVAEPGGIAITL